MAGENRTDTLDLFEWNMPEEIIEVQNDIVLTSIENKEDSKVVDDVKSQEIVGNVEEEKALLLNEVVADSPADSDKVIPNVASYLKELGFFPSFDKPITTAEELAEAFKAEVKNNEFSSLNDIQKDYLKSLDAGISIEAFNNHLETTKILSEITNTELENDKELCRQLIVQEAILKGNSTDKANRMYQRSFDVGEAVSDAKEAKIYLSKIEDIRYQEELREAEEVKVGMAEQSQKQLDELREAVYASTPILSNLTLDEGIKDKVYKNMTEIVAYSADGTPLNKLMQQRAKNPIEFEKNLYCLFTLTNEFKDMDRLNVKSSTEAAKRLQAAMMNNTFIKTGANTNYGSPKNVAPIVDIE